MKLIENYNILKIYEFYFRFIYVLNGVNGIVLLDWLVFVGVRMTVNVFIIRVFIIYIILDMVG